MMRSAGSLNEAHVGTANPICGANRLVSVVRLLGLWMTDPYREPFPPVKVSSLRWLVLRLQGKWEGVQPEFYGHPT